MTGASPVVDTTTTTMGTNFTKEMLTEIPNARDVWAAMSQAPGIQMQGFDVGGSHAGTQTGYVTYGMDVQNQTKIEGIDTDGRHHANAGYFDFGSFEEFQIGGAGNNAEQLRAGRIALHQRQVGRRSVLRQLVQRLAGRATISDNVPDNLRIANSKDDDGFFTRTPLDKRQPDRPPVRHQLQRRRADLEEEGVVLLQLSPRRSVQVHPRLR